MYTNKDLCGFRMNVNVQFETRILLFVAMVHTFVNIRVMFFFVKYKPTISLIISFISCKLWKLAGVCEEHSKQLFSLVNRTGIKVEKELSTNREELVNCPKFEAWFWFNTES